MGRLRLITYAAPALPLAMLGLPLYAYVPKLYADLPAIGLGLAGLLLFVSRLFDLITDPLMGALADRLRPWVHPLAWIVTGVPVVLFGVWYLFDPGPSTTPLDLLMAAGITYLGWTLVTVPYHAWGAELADHDHGRRGLSAWREGAVLCGALLALLAAALPGEASPLVRMAWLITVLLPLGVMWTWTLPRENKPQLRTPPGPAISAWKGLDTSTWRLIGLHFMNALAAGIPGTLFLMFAEERLGLVIMDSGWLLLVYFGAGVMALPLWLRLAKRIGDASTWGLAVLLAALAFVPAAWLGDGDVGLFTAICLVTGATLGADIALPAAILARLANRESRLHGRPREGSAFGLFGMVGKLALAFAVGLSFPLLQVFSVDAGPNPLLPWFYALVPALIKILVAVMVFHWRHHWDGFEPGKDSKEMCDETSELAPDPGIRFNAGRV